MLTKLSLLKADLVRDLKPSIISHDLYQQMDSVNFSSQCRYSLPCFVGAPYGLLICTGFKFQFQSSVLTFHWWSKYLSTAVSDVKDKLVWGQHRQEVQKLLQERKKTPEIWTSTFPWQLGRSSKEIKNGSKHDFIHTMLPLWCVLSRPGVSSRRVLLWSSLKTFWRN